MYPPTTAIEIIKVWRQRDRRYAVRKHAGIRATLTDDEILTVQDWRAAEVRDLIPREQPIAIAALRAWRPPVVLK